MENGIKLIDFTSSPNLAPFIVSLMLMFGQQLSGMNAVMFYCVDIFKVDIIYKLTITQIKIQIDIFNAKSQQQQKDEYNRLRPVMCSNKANTSKVVFNGQSDLSFVQKYEN